MFLWLNLTNLFFNFAGTNEVLENERRGLFSYNALKSRLVTNKFETSEIRDFAQPVIKLLPISHDEIFVLLQKLKAIFEFNYKAEVDISDNEIHQFMEEIFNKPGASEFLTPREVIRDYLNVLNLIRQNPSVDKKKIFGEIQIKDERPDDSAAESVEEF